jgi:hypothetical protein
VDERLRNALDAGHTIITASARLARLVRLELAQTQAERGSGVWTPPTILAWHDWLSRLHEELRWTSSGSARALLNPAHEHCVWEQLVVEDAAGDLLGSAATARQARAAWGMLHGWRLPEPAAAPLASEEVRAFSRWMRGYQERCEDQSWLDGARLPDALRVAIDASIIAPPAGMLVLGFEQLTPQQRALLRAIAARGARIAVSSGPRGRANARRVELASVEDELTTAVRWAGRLLASGEAGRIAILVPDLATRRATAQRLFDDILAPGAVLPGRGETRRPFNVASGPPLADHAIVRAARAVLALLSGRITLADLSRILRSPFVAGGVSRAPQRAMFDVWLREQGIVELDVGQLSRYVASFAGSRGRIRRTSHSTAPSSVHGRVAGGRYALLARRVGHGDEPLSPGLRLAGRAPLDARGAGDGCGVPGRRRPLREPRARAEPARRARRAAAAHGAAGAGAFPGRASRGAGSGARSPGRLWGRLRRAVDYRSRRRALAGAGGSESLHPAGMAAHARAAGRNARDRARARATHDAQAAVLEPGRARLARSARRRSQPRSQSPRAEPRALRAAGARARRRARSWLRAVHGVPARERCATTVRRHSRRGGDAWRHARAEAPGGLPVPRVR